MENNRIKRFKDFNESQDPMGSSTMSMRTPNAAMPGGGMDRSNPFDKQRLIQNEVIRKITKDAVDEVEDGEDEDEENED